MTVQQTEPSADLENHRAASLLDAQRKAAELFSEIEKQGLIRAGATESGISKEIFRLSRDMFNAGRHWHKRVIRAGVNTIHPYQAEPEDRVIEADDIVYVDLGPVFADWEADFGRSYVLGGDQRKRDLCALLPKVFAAGKRHFQSHADITGAELYRFMTEQAHSLGWDFGNGHAGHLVGEFPHEKIHGDQVSLYIHPENTASLRSRDAFGLQRHWILEVHLIDRDKRYGGFYEDLLTIGDLPA
ncbi:MAG TPA: M24 family metallopeptidase [Terriglobales bacterium]|nr:M24 family metallopeptidase [Terriglobales bacterium]